MAARASRPLRARRSPTVHDHARQAIDDLRALLAGMPLPERPVVAGPWPPPCRTVVDVVGGHLDALEQVVAMHEAL